MQTTSSPPRSTMYNFYFSAKDRRNFCSKAPWAWKSSGWWKLVCPVADLNSTAESEYEFGSCYSSLGRFPSTSSVTGILPSPPPPPIPMQSRHPVSPNGGLGELSGMLAAKMSFGNPGAKVPFGNGVDDINRRRNFLVDDAQSRDSGEPQI